MVIASCNSERSAVVIASCNSERSAVVIASCNSESFADYKYIYIEFQTLNISAWFTISYCAYLMRFV